MKTYEEKKKALSELMDSYTKQDLCIAFSGGVDSSVLLQLARTCVRESNRNSRIHAVTFHTILHPSCDLEIAKQVAEEAEAIHKVLFVNELEQEEIRFNPKNRCYLCKKALFRKLKDYAQEHGITCILEGTNDDDLHVYRPGLQAVKEMGVFSPLATAGLTKGEVRRLAEELGVSVAKRPSTPCLATRLPYGAEIRSEILETIARGEEYLKQQDFPVVRLRLHGEIVRIEIPVEDFEKFLNRKTDVTAYLKALGFRYITLDMEGFRSGSMDE